MQLVASKLNPYTFSPSSLLPQTTQYYLPNADMLLDVINNLEMSSNIWEESTGYMLIQRHLYNKWLSSNSGMHRKSRPIPTHRRKGTTTHYLPLQRRRTVTHTTARLRLREARLERWLSKGEGALALPGSLDSVSRTHVRRLIDTSNSSSRRIRCLWPPNRLHLGVDTYTQTHTQQ